ncbi:hypothetical protein [uncultured Phascolarctobacterium sp.]|jgi:hypothetical protein|uniref:hypothetical protein n=1 Tax=uncultured Phascolarctobacterium sp. TaxID=512296 RepID=UPI0025F68CEE|nr:hypothetical protein [uncultured Phascolarctobacterium sp.]
MKIVISLLTILLTFPNFVYAEIIQKINTFDNTPQIKSYYKDKNIKLPQILIFKKTGNDYYLLGKNAFRTINYLTTLENAKIKINDKIYSVEYRTFDLSNNFSFKFNDEILKEIKNANNIQIQLPIHTTVDTDIVDYYSFSIPKNVLNEWKQVIAME